MGQTFSAMQPEAEFIDEIQTKSPKSFPPCYSQSPLQLCISIIFFKLTQHLTYFYSITSVLYSVHCKRERRKT
jgi:hypothetical protein